MTVRGVAGEQGWTQGQMPILADIYIAGIHLWLRTSLPTHIFVSSPTHDALRRFIEEKCG